MTAVPAEPVKPEMNSRKLILPVSYTTKTYFGVRSSKNLGARRNGRCIQIDGYLRKGRLDCIDSENSCHALQRQGTLTVHVEIVLLHQLSQLREAL